MASSLPTPVSAYLALGSNLGDRQRHLQAAADALAAEPGIHVAQISPVYETEAHVWTPGEVQPPFLNAVVHVQTTRSARALLDACHAIERQRGRTRSHDQRWSARTLDLDLLTYGQGTVTSPNLTLPHPRIAGRRFVLQPFADLAPDLHLPAPYDATVRTLLNRCTDPHAVHRLDATLTLPSSAHA